MKFYVCEHIIRYKKLLVDILQQHPQDQIRLGLEGRLQTLYIRELSLQHLVNSMHMSISNHPLLDNSSVYAAKIQDRFPYFVLGNL